MNRPAHSRNPKLLLLVIATAMMLFVGVTASADATSNIEGVWSFNGGQIAVQPLPNGTFAGTVVVETKFTNCTHPVGQQIWTGMTPQPDGSYWGLHVWYEESKPGSCEEDPVRGPTAWRVLQEPDGSSYLHVCFSTPGTSQPTIATNGAPKGSSEYAEYHVTYNCANSALTAPLPVAPGATGSGTTGSGTTGSGSAGPKETLTLPSAKQCVSVRLFKIHLVGPQYDPLKKVTVTLKGRRIAVVQKGKYFAATINLKGLRRGAFTINVHATTVLGHQISASRTYHTCIKKIKRSGEKKPSKKG